MGPPACPVGRTSLGAEQTMEQYTPSNGMTLYPKIVIEEILFSPCNLYSTYDGFCCFPWTIIINRTARRWLPDNRIQRKSFKVIKQAVT